MLAIFVVFSPSFSILLPCLTLEVSSELEELATQGPSRPNSLATGEIEGVLKGPLNTFRIIFLDGFDELRVSSQV